MASYHGIPQKYFDKGDPYHCYCHKTSRLITEELKGIEIKTTFQSRFGPEKWLQPYTDKTLESLPKEGKKNIIVICPGFSSDCVETLEEICGEISESFMEAGGKNFLYIPCLNDDKAHIDMFFNVFEIVSYLSKDMSLYPGDIIACGTNAGLGPMNEGDVISIEIEGIGSITNKMTS